MPDIIRGAGVWLACETVHVVHSDVFIYNTLNFKIKTCRILASKIGNDMRGIEVCVNGASYGRKYDIYVGQKYVTPENIFDLIDELRLVSFIHYLCNL
jgi:hypothetical protein